MYCDNLISLEAKAIERGGEGGEVVGDEEKGGRGGGGERLIYPGNSKSDVTKLKTRSSI